MDNGLGRLRITILEHTTVGSDILPVITYGINQNGALNIVYNSNSNSNLYVAGWADVLSS